MSTTPEGYVTEFRECQYCTHSRKATYGWICKKHLMAIVPMMHVTFKKAKGTCWTKE